MSTRVCPGRHAGGAPPIYRDETILLTLLVLRAWRLSLEKMADWLGRYGALALTLGSEPQRTISAAQRFRRSRRLELWPDFFLFVGWSGPARSGGDQMMTCRSQVLAFTNPSTGRVALSNTST